MTKLERNKKIYSCHKNGKSQKEIGEFFGQIVTNTLEEIKADKELVKSFFKHKELKCYHFFS